MSEITIKPEIEDDPEVEELAQHIINTNKMKMLRSFVPNMKITKIQDGVDVPVTPKESGGIDFRSEKGHFGWSHIGGEHIPYIFRNEEKYCAVRMIDMKVNHKYINFLHEDIFKCVSTKSYYITEIECKLFNEINQKHCDFQFGMDVFTISDLIVPLTDANELYEFLDSCYTKLIRGTSTTVKRCGFIRINKESVVPYVISNNEKHVPLFYFEGDVDDIKSLSSQIIGWDLAYLKFCCRVQGINNSLYTCDSCIGINLRVIKENFLPETEFEDYWPNTQTRLLINGNGQPQSSQQWMKLPTKAVHVKVSLSNIVTKGTPKITRVSSSMPQPRQQVATYKKLPYNFPNLQYRKVFQATSSDRQPTFHSTIYDHVNQQSHSQINHQIMTNHTGQHNTSNPANPSGYQNTYPSTGYQATRNPPPDYRTAVNTASVPSYQHQQSYFIYPPSSLLVRTPQQ